MRSWLHQSWRTGRNCIPRVVKKIIINVFQELHEKVFEPQPNLCFKARYFTIIYILYNTYYESSINLNYRIFR